MTHVTLTHAKRDKRKHLLHWLRWWTERKTHFSKAYQPLHNAPTTNLSEPVNSSFQRRGNANISLIDAALEDVTDSVLLEKAWLRLSQGDKVYGSGPTQTQLRQGEKSNHVSRAEQMVEEMELYCLSDGGNENMQSREDANRTAVIDPECSHRPTKASVNETILCVTKILKKPRYVSMFDDTDEYSSSSSDNDASTKDSRPRVFRRKKSLVFQRSVAEGKRSKHEMAVKESLSTSTYER